MQGCGKSLCAKAASSLWKLPLLRFDIGRVFGSLVGSSEESMRRAIQTAESVAPAILWIDEIDKAFAGTQGSAGSDGGTASRVFGTFLTWLSEKTAPVFVIATANDISHLPPELLRKGRVDEIFFVDLPNEDERREIFRIHLAKRKRDPAKFDLDALARMSDGFSGAEIEEAIISGLYDAFSKGDGPRHGDPARRHRRDRAPLQDHERRAQPPAQLGAGPCPAVDRAAQAARTRHRRDTAQAGNLIQVAVPRADSRPEGDRPMSSVLVVAPLVVASWPLLSAAITAAVGTMGFAAAQNQGPHVRQITDPKTRAEIELEDSEILAGSGGDRRGDGRRARRHPRHLQPRRAGRLKLCVEGSGHSKAELKRIGEALVGRVTQQYAYHRLVSELKERQMTILEERVGEDQAIHIRVRSG